MSLRDWPFCAIEPSVFHGGYVSCATGYLVNEVYWDDSILHWSGSSNPKEMKWSYVDDLSAHGLWECQHCMGVYKNNVLKCSQCGAHRKFNNQ